MALLTVPFQQPNTTIQAAIVRNAFQDILAEQTQRSAIIQTAQAQAQDAWRRGDQLARDAQRAVSESRNFQLNQRRQTEIENQNAFGNLTTNRIQKRADESHVFNVAEGTFQQEIQPIRRRAIEAQAAGSELSNTSRELANRFADDTYGTRVDSTEVGLAAQQLQLSKDIQQAEYFGKLTDAEILSREALTEKTQSDTAINRAKLGALQQSQQNHNQLPQFFGGQDNLPSVTLFPESVSPGGAPETVEGPPQVVPAESAANLGKLSFDEEAQLSALSENLRAQNNTPKDEPDPQADAAVNDVRSAMRAAKILQGNEAINRIKADEFTRSAASPQGLAPSAQQWWRSLTKAQRQQLEPGMRASLDQNTTFTVSTIDGLLEVPERATEGVNLLRSRIVESLRGQVTKDDFQPIYSSTTGSKTIPSESLKARIRFAANTEAMKLQSTHPLSPQELGSVIQELSSSLSFAEVDPATAPAKSARESSKSVYESLKK